MSAYLKASLAALALLALALWWGWDRDEAAAAAPRVRLSTDAAWSHAALEAGATLLTRRPGDEVSVPPGRWRVTLVPREGEPVLFTCDLRPGESRVLGDAP